MVLERVHEKLEAGRRDAAQDELGRAVERLFCEHVAAGHAEHPVLSATAPAFIAELRTVAPRLCGPYVGDLLSEIAGRIARRDGRDVVVLLFNHALCLLVPDFPLRAAEAVATAKNRLARRIDEESGDGFSLLPGDGGLLIAAASLALRELDAKRYDRIASLDLAALDAPERCVAGLPVIVAITNDGGLAFDCPSCGARRSAALADAGDTHACSCGAWTRVPIPGLVRLEAHLRRKKNAELGLGSCRGCGAVIQTGRAGFMRAGFCGALCASRAPERFGEFVPRDGARRGGAVAFRCRCGAELEAPVERAGTRMRCGSCALEVWVPAPPAEAGRPSVRACAGCGRKIKSTAPRCIYCGRGHAP